MPTRGVLTHDSGAAEIGLRRSSRELCDEESSGRPWHWHWQALPRSPLWKGRGGSKEALLVVRELIRHDRGGETAWKLHLLVRSKVSRLLKLDLLASLNELQRLDKVDLALMVKLVIYIPSSFFCKFLLLHVRCHIEESYRLHVDPFNPRVNDRDCVFLW